MLLRGGQLSGGVSKIIFFLLSLPSIPSFTQNRVYPHPKGKQLHILGNPGLQRGWEGKGETASGKKGEGRGGEGKEERGSPGKLLYTDHFAIEEQTPLARCETEALV